jgi:hypothetical protein
MNYFKKSIQSGLEEYYQILKSVLANLNNSELFWRPSLQSNNIIFLVWHMGLVEDNLINKILCEKERIWVTDKYYEKFPSLKDETGFGFTLEELDNFPQMDLVWLMNYYDVVRERTENIIEKITQEDLSLNYTFKQRQVSGFWILGRLITEESQHLGQISYIRGLMRGLNH